MGSWSAGAWLNCCSTVAGSTSADITPRLLSTSFKSVNPEIRFIKASLARKCGMSVQSQQQQQQQQHYYSQSAGKGLSVRSASSSSWVEEDGATEESVGFEGSPEGSGIEDEQPDIMQVVMQKLAEEDLEEAAKKYKYEDELFSQIDFAQINAFTSKPFSGNPAAVCYLPYGRDENWLQLIAREFNLPATAFVVKRRQSRKKQAFEDEGLLQVDNIGDLKPVKKRMTYIENEFDIRWFSTTTELGLCGHATLASAHMLFSSGLVDGDTIIFHSKGGSLKASKIAGYDEPEGPSDQSEGEVEDPEARIQAKAELGKGVVELDFPLTMVSKVDSSEAEAVSGAFGGVETVWIGRTESGDYLVELPSRKHLEELQAQLDRMLQLPASGGVIATAAETSEDSKFDFVSRFFAPKQGIPEDPVSGKAHTILGPYWATKSGKECLQAYQASTRGGELSVRVDFKAGRVYLQGGAVLVMAGTLLNTFRA